MATKFIQAEKLPGSWKLPKNDIWNIPDEPCDELRGIIAAEGPWNTVKSYRALAVDMSGKVYGYRTMRKCKMPWAGIEGTVRIGGKDYRAFSSSKLFERPDGSLCDVAVLVVCGIDTQQA